MIRSVACDAERDTLSRDFGVKQSLGYEHHWLIVIDLIEGTIRRLLADKVDVMVRLGSRLKGKEGRKEGRKEDLLSKITLAEQ